MSNFTDKMKNIFSKKEVSKRDEAKPRHELTFSELPATLLSNEYRPFFHKIFAILFFMLILFIIGNIVGFYIKKSIPIKNKAPQNTIVSAPVIQTNTNYNKILLYDIFKAREDLAGQKEEKVIDLSIPCFEGAASSLPISIVNTTVLKDKSKSVATLNVRGESNYIESRTEDIIEGMVKIFQISRMSLVVRNLQNGECETIQNNENQGGRELVLNPNATPMVDYSLVEGIDRKGNKFILKKSVILSKINNMNEILTQARAIENQNPDGSRCFRIVEIDAGSIYSHLGIINNDSICKINGRPIVNVNQVMNLFGKLKTNLVKFNLNINRNGTDETFTYDFKD